MTARDDRFWREVADLFDAAVDLEATARRALLDARCGDATELRANVEALLDAHDGQERLLSAMDTVPPAVGVGSVIGSFRLVEIIGAGGMGTVYRAERIDGGFAQRVAVKVIAAPASNAAAARRVRAERQILAALSHPNIVSLLDGGVTPDGSAYLVMEYVEGRRIDRFCREMALDLAERLRLFRSVCSAVHYAHRHAVVHRDLKPANILVTAEGVPKVLDFGVAKLLDAPAAAGATATGFAVGPLTPNYASPEQLRGLPLTTSSDVYALGVLLYELLTDTRPYETQGKPLDEVMRLVIEAEPPRPSASVRDLKGDLDAVILRAMSKEPEQRYRSAEELADDVGRYLSGAPVAAHEPSLGYVVRKLAGRHKTAFLSATISLVLIVAALIVAIWQARAAMLARDRARVEASKAQATATFLAGVFQGADPVRMRGQTPTARQLLDRGTASIATELRDQPDVQASLLIIMADAYDHLAVGDTAYVLAKQAVELRRRVFPSQSLEVAESLFRLGRYANRAGRPEEALRALEETLRIQEALLGPADGAVADTLHGIALLRWHTGRTDGIGDLFERAIRIKQAHAPQDVTLARMYNSLGAWLNGTTGRTADVIGAYERSIGIYEQVTGPDNWEIALPLVNLGDLFVDLEEPDKAQPLYERVLQVDKQVFGAESTGVAYSLDRMGNAARVKGDLPKARALIEEALAIYTRIAPPDHLEVAAVVTHLGLVHMAEGAPRRALPLFERALRNRERHHGGSHAAVAEALIDVADARRALGDPAAAKALLRRALAVQERALKVDHPSRVRTLTRLGEIETSRGAFADARAHLSEALRIAAIHLPARHSQRVRAETAMRALDRAATPVRGVAR